MPAPHTLNTRIMTFDPSEQRSRTLLPPASSLVRSSAPPQLRAPRPLLSAPLRAPPTQHDSHGATAHPTLNIPRGASPLHPVAQQVQQSPNVSVPQQSPESNERTLNNAHSSHMTNSQTQYAPRDPRAPGLLSRPTGLDTRATTQPNGVSHNHRETVTQQDIPMTPRSLNGAPSVPLEAPTFDGLVQEMLGHPALAVAIQLAFQAGGAGAVTVSEENGAAEALRAAERRSQDLAQMASEIGIETACKRSSSLEVFLSALVSALGEVPDVIPKLTPTLRETLTACEGAVAASSSSGDASGNGTRCKLSAGAREILETWFNDHFENPYPNDEEKHALAAKCDIHLNQVNNYFGNRRMRMKRKIIQMQHRGDTVGNGTRTAAYESSVLAPRTKWRAIVFPHGTASEYLPPRTQAQPHDTLVTTLFRGNQPRGSAAAGPSRRDYPELPPRGYVPPPQSNHPDPHYADAPHPVMRYSEPDASATRHAGQPSHAAHPAHPAHAPHPAHAARYAEPVRYSMPARPSVSYNAPPPASYNAHPPLNYNTATPVHYSTPVPAQYNAPPPVHYNAHAPVHYVRDTPVLRNERVAEALRGARGDPSASRRRVRRSNGSSGSSGSRGSRTDPAASRRVPRGEPPREGGRRSHYE